MPKIDNKDKNIWLAFPFMLTSNKFKRNDLKIYLEKNNIQTRTIFSGNILKQPGYPKKYFKLDKQGYKNSDFVMNNGILLGSHQSMTLKELRYITQVIERFIKKLNV